MPRLKRKETYEVGEIGETRDEASECEVTLGY